MGEVLTFLLNRQTTTRREIAERTGLSPAAVTKALQPMLGAGLVEESSLPRELGRRAGRPTQQVRIVPGRITALGVKLTATELIAVVTDLAGMITEQVRVPLVSRGPVLDVGQVIDAIASLVGEISGRRRLDQVGIAISGDVDTDRGLVVLSPLLGWQDVDFADRLAGAVRLPVIIDNDIRALTVAERSFGDAFGIDNFAVVTIGEGIGCGLVIGGRVLRGAFGVAGELGHMIIDAAAAPATLTADGVPGLGQVEQLISRAGVVRRAGTVTGKAIGTVAELIRLVGDGDARVAELLTTIGRELGLTVANLVNLTGPQRLVISSEGFDLDAAFGPALDATIRMHAFGQAAQVEIIHREIPFTEWARGAAVVALNQRVAQIC